MAANRIIFETYNKMDKSGENDKILTKRTKQLKFEKKKVKTSEKSVELLSIWIWNNSNLLNNISMAMDAIF